MTENHATTEFNLIWQNDYDVYHATLDYAKSCLAHVPGMTDQTLGRNVKDRVFAWAYGGGWGWSSGWRDVIYPLVGQNGNPFTYFIAKESYGDVSEEAVAEQVRDAFGAEGI